MQSIVDRARAVNAWLREFVFVIDSLVLGLLVLTLVITGINPFDSPALLVAISIGIVIMATHHVWYARHRDEAELDHSRLAGRERRGF